MIKPILGTKKIRRVICIIIGLFCILLLIGIFKHNSTNSVNNEASNFTVDFEEPLYTFPKTVLFENNNNLDDLLLAKKNNWKFQSNVYNQLFMDHSIESVLSLSFNQRCELLIRNIISQKVSWIFDPLETFEINYESEDYIQFIQQEGIKLNKKFEKIKNNLKFKTSLNNFIKDEYKIIRSKQYEQKIIDQLTILRIFNKCFIKNGSKDQNDLVDRIIQEQQKLVTKANSAANGQLELELKLKLKLKLTENEKMVLELVEDYVTLGKRVYPWISQRFPFYERWNGDSYYYPPNYEEIFKDKNEPLKSEPSTVRDLTSSPLIFLNQFKDASNGKGIVLSITEKHIDDTINLIRLLRALNNKLPIQIIYFNDISQSSKTKIIKAAREEINNFPKSYEKVYHGKQPSVPPSPPPPPPQEVWFVNIYESINPQHRNLFAKFDFKLLASLFNSFNEFMLIDADTILMKSPEFFFNHQSYQQTGAFFFKDRSPLLKRPITDGEFLIKMGPSSIDSIMFDIPMMTQYTTHRELFKGLRLYMESGLVMIDKQRRRHFNSILMMNQLKFIHPISNSMWGDKELFWLGFAINGDENYKFNNHFAAAIGQLTSNQYNKDRRTPLNSKEICSSHPGHISDEDDRSLLWFNSGFRFCHEANNIDYQEETKNNVILKFLNGRHPLEFKKYYSDPLRITHAIVPPLNKNFQKMYNYDEEPTDGWTSEPNCNKYMWCAYSSIGGRTGPEETSHKETLDGLLVEYTPEEIAYFNYLGDVWVGKY